MLELEWALKWYDSVGYTILDSSFSMSTQDDTRLTSTSISLVFQIGSISVSFCMIRSFQVSQRT